MAYLSHFSHSSTSSRPCECLEGGTAGGSGCATGLCPGRPSLAVTSGVARATCCYPHTQVRNCMPRTPQIQHWNGSNERSTQCGCAIAAMYMVITFMLHLMPNRSQRFAFMWLVFDFVCINITFHNNNFDCQF